MKIAVILLASLVSISCQQRIFLNIPLVPRANYLPFLYGGQPNAANVLTAQVQFIWTFCFNTLKHGHFDGQADSSQEATDDTENEFARSKPLQPQSRFMFGFNPFNPLGWYGNGNLGGNNFGNQNGPTIVTSTYTSWTTTTANATTATLQYCIANNAFASSQVAGATVFSTGPCARRRREVALFEDFLESVEPSEPKE